uniref:START domain-containing protein n=1 Tax=Leersia perrieri TaxID=77586 RepID=A0A0D9VFU3_9ORYZ
MAQGTESTTMARAVPPPPEAAAILLAGAELWRPVARGGGWATAGALLLLLVSHLTVLLLRRIRLHRRRLLLPEAVSSSSSSSSAVADATTSSNSAAGIEGLVTEGDLAELVGNLGVAAREPEREGWQEVVAKGNDDVSYRVWCDKPMEGPPRYLSVTTYERCSTELLRDFYMDNEYRMEWDNTVIKHDQLQYDENCGIEIGRTVKKFPLLTPREYILAWRVWEGNDKSFYCLVKECEHSLAPRQRKFVRVQLLRSGWCIRKIPGRDACQITVLHHEDNGMNIEMAKLAFAKGIWNYICKMNSALRRYPQHHISSISILTMQRLIKKFPQALETDVDANQPQQGNTGATVPSHFARTSSQPVKKSSRATIASGLLLIGSIVCLSRGRSNLGAQLAMAFFLKKAFKKDKGLISQRSRSRADVTESRHLE